eukprot:TRINITY_DN35269_c0_g1_i1.p1 TRINITY_DN35269_c0_g1~~TRINITY_DN35269_c0_g1_i1.p1  ORF type:complete len:1384 (-),score=308.98 TRINITY_DN35269_c0_g1_i1:77-4015(-)
MSVTCAVAWLVLSSAPAGKRSEDVDARKSLLGLQEVEAQGMRIGFLQNRFNSWCLDLESEATFQTRSQQGSSLFGTLSFRSGEKAAVATECKLNEYDTSQIWVSTPAGGLRNLVVRHKCLYASSFSNLGGIESSYCKDNASNSAGYFQLVNESLLMAVEQGRELRQEWCAQLQPGILGKFSPNGIPVVMTSCASPVLPKTQNEWQFVDVTSAALLTGVLAQASSALEGDATSVSPSGKVTKAAREEVERRYAAQQEAQGSLFNLIDVVKATDIEPLLNGQFWLKMRYLFQFTSPKWSKWEETISLWTALDNNGTWASTMGSGLLANFLSNMIFAGMNFVYGSSGENLRIWGIYELYLTQFTGLPLKCDDQPGDKRASCTWRVPDETETLGVVPITTSVSELPEASKLLSSGNFSNLYTAEKVPSWEDSYGQETALAIAAAGVAAARSAGMEPSQAAAAHAQKADGRFAFDRHALQDLVDFGFGWFHLRDLKYASNGAFGAKMAENEKFEDECGSTLPILMESVLSMHLRALQEEGELLLVLDLTAFEKYAPIDGFASLGGKAFFAPQNANSPAASGTLKLVRLEYNGTKYTNFQDPQSQDDFNRSTLSGWRYAEKAIIASLLAKTQLLVHVKAIHMELAPVLQAVTVDSLAGRGAHPLRMLLEPFIHRSVQATKNNLKVWFEFRAAEFGLAPLPVEEQVRLLHDMSEEDPLDLADLDMETYAEARGMQQFTTAEPVELGTLENGVYAKASTFQTEGSWARPWQWVWHDRALKVQRNFEVLIRSWLRDAYHSNDELMQNDPGLVTWWISLFEHMPALQRAANGTSWLSGSGTFFNSNLSSAVPISADAEKNMVPLPLLVPKIPQAGEKLWTGSTKTTTTSTIAPSTTVTGAEGFYNPIQNIPQDPRDTDPQFAQPMFYDTVQNLPAPWMSTTKLGFFDSFKGLFSGGSRRLSDANTTSDTGSSSESLAAISASIDRVAAEVGITTSGPGSTSAAAVATTASAPGSTSTTVAEVEGAGSTSSSSSTASDAVSTTTSILGSSTNSVSAADSSSAADQNITQTDGVAWFPATAATAVASAGVDATALGAPLQTEVVEATTTTAAAPVSSTTSAGQLQVEPEAEASNATNATAASNGTVALPAAAGTPSSRTTSTLSPETVPSLPPGVPEITAESFMKVMRTLLVWISWIHEDVGHASAAFVYGPVETPGFVPVDGRGIPAAAYLWRVAAFRNFVALERNKLTDRIDSSLFSNKTCAAQVVHGWTACEEVVHGSLLGNFLEFQKSIKDLGTNDPLFLQCGKGGFWSCMGQVESSASS